MNHLIVTDDMHVAHLNEKKVPIPLMTKTTDIQPIKMCDCEVCNHNDKIKIYH